MVEERKTAVIPWPGSTCGTPASGSVRTGNIAPRTHTSAPRGWSSPSG